MKIMFGGSLFGKEALCSQGIGIIKQLKKYHTVEIDGPIQEEGYWKDYFGNFKREEAEVYIMNGHIPYIPLIAKEHKKIIHITQFESKFPDNWVECLNHPNIKEIWTMSEFTKKLILKSGIKKSVKVIYLGLDQRFFKNDTNIFIKDKSFKFFNICAPHGVGIKDRKGLDVLLPAFKEEFGNNPNITLIIKINPIYMNMYHKDRDVYDYIQSLLPNENNFKNISIITDYYPINVLNDLYNSIDCGVFPSRSEGFGFPQAELIKIGKPVISTDYSATNEFTDPNLRIKINGMETLDIDIPGHPYENMLFAKPDKESLKNIMRNVYLNYKDNLEYAKKLSKSEMIKMFDWDKIGIKLNELLKKI